MNELRKGLPSLLWQKKYSYVRHKHPGDNVLEGKVKLCGLEEGRHMAPPSSPILGMEPRGMRIRCRVLSINSHHV